jgi:uncharacterized membrane protein
MKEEMRSLIKLDYEKTLSFIDKIDDILFRIKNWTITTNAAIFAVAISTKNKNCLAINFVSISCFWLLELFYKCFHEDALRKSYLMEELIYSDPEDEKLRETYTFGIGHAVELPNIKKVLRIVFSRFHMTFLYIGLLILTLLGFCLFDKLFTIHKTG